MHKCVIVCAVLFMFVILVVLYLEIFDEEVCVLSNEVKGWNCFQIYSQFATMMEQPLRTMVLGSVNVPHSLLDHTVKQVFPNWKQNVFTATWF